MSYHVLILDDDIDLRSILQAQFSPPDFTVVQAETAEHATQIVNTAKIDLVIADGNLPDQPGVAWIEQTRKTHPQLIVVFITGHWKDFGTFQHLTGDLDVSFVAYKPIDARRFADRIKSLLTTTLPRETAEIPVTHDSSEFAAAMHEMKEGFRAQLPDKIAQVAAAITALKHRAFTIDQVMTLAHRLRGSAGTYGFHGVTAAMTTIEELLRAALEPAHVMDQAWYDALAKWIESAKHFSTVPTSEQQMALQSLESAPTPSVLLVNNDPVFLEQASRVAKKMMLNITTAATEREALTKAQSMPFIGAVVDMRVSPHDDPFSVVRGIRETTNNDAIPIAISSVSEDLDTRVAAIAAGGSQLIDKPFSEETFEKLLNGLIESSVAQQHKILIVDDDPEICAWMGALVKNAHLQVKTMESAESLLDTLSNWNPDVLMLDIELPHCSGIDICRALRASPRWQLLPIILITAHHEAQMRIDGFRAGATDYISKPLIGEEVLARLRVRLDHLTLMRERSERDNLTGMMLRGSFSESFERALAASRREKRSISVALLDIDRFKQINDTHGHLVGDTVLSSFGQYVRRRFRVEDLRGRWGGEEFIIAFVGQSASFAEGALLRLLVEFSAMKFHDSRGVAFSVTFTAGIASFPKDGDSLEALVRCADERMYEGKRQGRNRIIGS